MASVEEIKGLNELLRSMQRIEKLPQVVVNRVAKSGAKIALAYARFKAPEDTGTLRKGIKLIGEKSRYKGKKVFQTVFDRAYNHMFVKMSGSKRYYYPASQEFGFQKRKGGYVPGYHFLEKSMTTNAAQMEREMVNTMANEVDKAW